MVKTMTRKLSAKQQQTCKFRFHVDENKNNSAFCFSQQCVAFRFHSGLNKNNISAYSLPQTHEMMQ